MLQDAKYADLKLDGFTATRSIFRRCTFEHLAIRSACFGGGRKETVYEACSFDDSRIDCGAAGIARFIACTFRGTYLYNFFGLDVSMIDCVFSGALHKVVFYGRSPETQRLNDFRGNDFSAARLTDVGFRNGIDLKLQRLPAGWVAPHEPYVRGAE